MRLKRRMTLNLSPITLEMTMQYTLLIHCDESELAKWTPEQWAEAMDGCHAMIEEMTQAGVYVTSQRLQPSSMATTVRVRGGKTTITDGPYAETKELLAGFYLIDVASHEDAVGWAKKIPQAKFSSVEVRPIAVK